MIPGTLSPSSQSLLGEQEKVGPSIFLDLLTWEERGRQVNADNQNIDNTVSAQLTSIRLLKSHNLHTLQDTSRLK